MSQGNVGIGSWLCQNAEEIAPWKNVNEFSSPQADQNDENRKKLRSARPFSAEFNMSVEFSHRQGQNAKNGRFDVMSACLLTPDEMLLRVIRRVGPRPELRDERAEHYGGSRQIDMTVKGQL